LEEEEYSPKHSTNTTVTAIKHTAKNNING
jgi:hypothetical protein